MTAPRAKPTVEHIYRNVYHHQVHLGSLYIRHLRHLVLQVCVRDALDIGVDLFHHLLQLFQVIANRNQLVIVHGKK